MADDVEREGMGVCVRVSVRVCMIGTITLMPGSSEVKREDICTRCLFHICLIDLNKSNASLL